VRIAFCSALASSYVDGAEQHGHIVHRIDAGALEFSLIRSEAQFLAVAPSIVQELQAQVRGTDHLVLIYPLWLGGPPAALKGLLEQVFRYSVALGAPGGPMKRLLKGESARVVVTCGMPASVFWLVFGAHGLKAESRGLLWMSGMSPVREVVIGGAGGASPGRRRWLGRMRRWGGAAV
jgi:putative NADPH-quinone reductase